MTEWYRADLHVHTVLSPCAELEMGPRALIERSSQLGISILGITDHNAASNLPALQEVGRQADIFVLPGMELQSREEVHLLCFFPGLNTVQSFEQEFASTLPDLENREEIFGDQVVVDSREQILDYDHRLLIASSDWGVEEVVERVRFHGGGVIPAHIDRSSYSILSNLGFIPPGSEFMALEIANYQHQERLCQQYTGLDDYSFITSSDAHHLDELETDWVTYLYLQERNWEEIRLALNEEAGRRVVVLPEGERPCNNS